MKIHVTSLLLRLKRSTERIEFPNLSYFYGPIGSGKSSIARLVDYCLGATVEWTPALQQELVSASLALEIGVTPLQLQRDIGSGQIIATWREASDTLQVVLPAKVANGEVLPGTGVEVLSDLIFYLAEVEPPKVRRQKGTPNEHLERLSFRELYRFCYLDQNGMDSDFYKLNSDNYAVQRKSVDTLRYLLGYHHEQLAELEAKLQTVREERLARQAGADVLAKALLDSGFEDAFTIDARIEETKAQIQRARADAKQARESREPLPHAVDELRARVRDLSYELASTEAATADLADRCEHLATHDNQLKMLAVRYQRTASARSILGGVDFSSCPRCSQALPQRAKELCPVCGQDEHITDGRNALDENVIKADLRARREELQEAILRMRQQHGLLARRAEELVQEKGECERALDVQMRTYDSAFLSQAIEHERAITVLEQRLNTLIHNRKLPDLLEAQRDVVEDLRGQEAKIREKLDAGRKRAFFDATNIRKLEQLFLDCLVRVNFPDVTPHHYVHIDPSTFDPKISLSKDGDFAVLSFANAGSGGMKSLFKTCYALAIHRLCASIGAPLPSLLVIDTATKNVSSKENPEVVNSFYQFVYELASTELSGTQIILIDNEYTSPSAQNNVEIRVRHMMNGSEEAPPLIPYLLGSLEVRRFRDMLDDDGGEESDY